jgi:hypothetical protein
MQRRFLFEQLGKLFPKSLVHDFYTIFGEAVTEKLLSIFSGTTIKVPSTEDLREAERDIIIYESLIKCPLPEEAKRVRKTLSRKYGLKKKNIRIIFKRMSRLHRMAKKVHEADHAVSQHKVKRIKIRKLKRQRRV